MGYHGKNLSRGNLRHHHGAFVNIELGIRNLLYLHIQCGIDIVPGILHARRVIGGLIAQGRTGIDQVIIRHRLHPHTPLGGITHNMGKHVRKRIHPGFILPLIRNGFGQHFPVPGINVAAVIPRQKDFLPGIVAVIQHLLLTGSRKIAEICNHCHKYRDKKQTCCKNFPFIVDTSGIGFPCTARFPFFPLRRFFFVFFLHDISLFILEAHSFS